MNTETVRGQVLVLVALALLALVAVVALAVDIGNVYRERRHMQNAADAGALAGAREICFGDTGTEAAAIATGEDYAVNRNDADGAIVTVGMPVTVTVVATKSVDTFFAGVIGFDEIPVQADATAICGKAAAAGGLWPVAFDVRRWDHLTSGEDPYIQCDETPRIVLIWEGNRVDCDTYDCCTIMDHQNNGNIIATLNPCNSNLSDDVIPLDNQAWVDFSVGISGNDPCDSSGCGTSEIRDRIDGYTGHGSKAETCESFVDLPDCFASPSGNTSAWSNAEAAGGRIVTIPLYDPCRSGTLGDPPLEEEQYCPADLDPPWGVCTMTKVPGTGCGVTRYWIDDMICLRIGVEIDGKWHTHGYLPLKEGASGAPGRVMIATVPCNSDLSGPHEECGTSPGWSTGEIPEAGDAKAVSLIE